jgi:hypothetical protein
MLAPPAVRDAQRRAEFVCQLGKSCARRNCLADRENPGFAGNPLYTSRACRVTKRAPGTRPLIVGFSPGVLRLLGELPNMTLAARQLRDSAESNA